MDPKTPAEMLQYRCQLYRDAHAFKKPERTPYEVALQTWQFYDAGYTPAVASRNYDIMEECITRFFRTYPVDACRNIGLRMPLLLSDAVGGQSVTNDENLSAVDICYMDPEDYDILLQGREAEQKLVYEKFFLNKFPKVRDFTPQEFAAAAKTYVNHIEAGKRIKKRLAEEFGIPQAKGTWGISNYFENLFCQYRGMKGMAMDMRRIPDKVYELCAQRDYPVNDKTAEEILASFDGPDMTQRYDIGGGFLGHVILNSKQFEKLYADPMEKILRAAEAKGKQVFFTSEGSVERVADFFNQFKKGTVSMIIEMDDPYEIRKKYPNICIYGGLKTEVMGHGTPKQCVDMAKRAIDELGCEGGLVLTENKFTAFPNDMNPENLKAVAEFVLNYRG